MIIRNFYEAKLAQASYLVGCSATGEAIVIDPLRDVQPYVDMAESLDLRIVAVTETHIHADFLSGTRELAAATDAKMYLSGEGGADWSYDYTGEPGVTLLKDGDRIEVGNVTLKAMHTPGHTPEHFAFLLIDNPVSSTPHSLFAGDFVFVGDVGRPDLLERAASIEGTMEQGARNLFCSLRKLTNLPDSLMLWPGHGSGSACGKSLGGSPVTSLGYERISNWALMVSNEDKFVDEILAGQPEPPLYFKEMKRLNKAGPAVLGGLPHPKQVTSAIGQLIDVRTVDKVRAASYESATAIPSGKGFTGYAGWVVSYDEAITLIADSQEQADQSARDLATIGLDDVSGWLPLSSLDQSRIAPIQTVTVSGIDRESLILDVRGMNERTVSSIGGSIHIPYGYLRSRLDELPRDRNIIVHCAAGGRSPIAYTMLRAAGFRNVSELPGGFSAVQAQSPELIGSS